MNNTVDKNAARTMESCILILMFNTSYAKQIMSVWGGHRMSEFFKVPPRNN